MSRQRLSVLLAVTLLACGCKRIPHPRISELSMAEPSLPAGRSAGVYEMTEGWRWTERVFGFSLDLPQTRNAIYLNFDFAVPKELFDDARAITLIATANGVEVGRQRYVKPGVVHFTRYLPQAALARTPVAIGFETDRSMPALNSRQRSLIALSVGLREYEETSEYRDAQNWLARQNASKVMSQVTEQFTPAKIIELRKLFFALPAIRNLEFQGIPIDRNPLDLWNMQQAAFEIRPRFVIDTATGEGGAALYWAHIFQGTGFGETKIITIDRQNRAAKASQNPLWTRYVEFIAGDLTDPALLARLSERVKANSVLVVLDAGQEVTPVLSAIRAYAPLVSRGSYMAVENTGMDSDPAGRLEGAGASEAVRRFLQEGGDKEFEVDSTRDMFVLTSSPGGWLRRK